MVINKDFVRRELLILALFMGLSGIQTILMCGKCSTWRGYTAIYVFTVFMWIFLWRGNHLLNDFISSRISWLQFPARRFFVGLAATLAYSFASVIFLMTIVQWVFNFSFGSSYTFTIYFSIFFTLMISLFLHSREFLQHWRRAALEAEKFEREKLTAQYENLKSRVNPQLLFKSLNTLKGLAVSDKEQAVKFIKNLSDVYRYILDTRNKELVPDHQELKFLKSFIYLLSKRLGPSLDVALTFSGKSFYVTPLSIQMIIETIVESARFDEQNPLQITVTENVSDLVIDANPQWRDDESLRALRGVLENIADRYKLLSSSPVRYEFGASTFIARLPQISMNDEE